jgi:acetyl esterase/lipase
MSKEQGYQILEDVVYYGKGEPFWKLDLALPVDSHNQMRPVVLLVHGGGFDSCTKREAFESHMLRFLASHGYVTASVEYRLSPLAPFPSQFADVRRALQFLRGHADEYRIDPDRIGAVGHSAGANLVSLLGLIPNDDWMDVKTPYSHYSGTVQVVIGLSGLYVFEPWKDDPDPGLLAWLGSLFPGRFKTIKDRMEDASPATYIGKHKASFLLVHGDQDAVCPLSQSETFLARLLQKGYRDVILKVYEKANHDTVSLPDLPDVILDFLDKRLK